MDQIIQQASIRPAMQADLPQIIGLDQSIFGWYGADEEPTIIEARLAIFPTGCIILCKDDQIVGYVTSEKWASLREPMLDENPYTTHDPDGRILCITTLAISQAQQGQGLGPLLLNEIISIAKAENCTQIVLETAHAVTFYQRHGFTKIGERTQRDIHLPIMSLKLNQTLS